MPNITYVCGHKNPDTDSVCSAISYAYLLQKLYPDKKVKPITAGPIMQQTQFILNNFKQEAPEVIMDITPRLKDLTDTGRYILRENDPISLAFSAFYEQQQKQFPVISKTNEYIGMIQLVDIMHQFIHPTNQKELQLIVVTINSLIRAIKGKLISNPMNIKKSDVLSLDLKIITSDYNVAMEALNNYTPETFQKSAFIVGSNPELIQYLIDKGTKLLILSVDSITRNSESGDMDLRDRISESRLTNNNQMNRGFDSVADFQTLLQNRSFNNSMQISDIIGQSKETIVIQSELNECSIMLLAKQAVPAKLLANKDPSFTISENLSLDDAIKHLDDNRHIYALAVLGEDGVLKNLVRRADLLNKTLVELVLVDHNEENQHVDGSRAMGVEIIEIIDHHKVCIQGDLAVPKMTVKPVGCTCTVLFEIYKQKRVEIPKHIGVLLMSAILTDTLVLKSPTATPKDKKTLEELQELVGVNYLNWGSEIFNSVVGFNVDDKKSVIKADYKIFDSKSGRYGVSQVEIGSLSLMTPELLTELRQLIKQIRVEDNIFLCCCLVTDVQLNCSLLLTDGPSQFRDVIGYDQWKEYDWIFDMPGVVSRKKQLIPHLVNVLSMLE